MSRSLRTLLERAYARYDARWIEPDPVQFVWRYDRTDDREVAGLVASSLAYGNVRQIKRSVGRVLDVLGERPARALDRMRPGALRAALDGFRHRFNDGRDASDLLEKIRGMRRLSGGVEAFFLDGIANAPRATLSDGASWMRSALSSFAERTLALDVGRSGPSRGPSSGVSFFFPSPTNGSACKRLCLFLRWMVRRDSVDPGGWTGIPRAALVIPLDAHVISIARRIGLTRRVSPGWRMAEEITDRLRACDPDDPVKYDFAIHRMGLFRRAAEVERLRSARESG